jgi:hypothetical protein
MLSSDSKFVIDPNKYEIDIEVPPHSQWLRTAASVVSLASVRPSTTPVLGVVGVVWLCGIKADSPWLVGAALVSIVVSGVLTEYLAVKENYAEKNRRSRTISSADASKDEEITRRFTTPNESDKHDGGHP